MSLLRDVRWGTQSCTIGWSLSGLVPEAVGSHYELRAASRSDDVFWADFATTTNDDQSVLLNAAPVVGGLALLGEAGKVAALSTRRFADVSFDDGILAQLRGSPGEFVSVQFASGYPDALICAVVNATIGGDGTAEVKFAG